MDEEDEEDGIIFNAKEFKEKESYSFLLTGATGYLGPYSLKDLILNHKQCTKVYCLVRSFHSFESSKQSLINLVKKTTNLELTDREFDKIYPIKGDISLKKLGLSEHDYQLLSNQVDIIVSVGASVSFSSPYQESKPTNVDSVKEILRLATSNPDAPLKRIVHVSTMAVFFNHKPIEKDSNLATLDSLNGKNGYFQSKAIAEHLLQQASLKGFEILIIRSPGLFASTETSQGNQSDLFQL